MSGSRIDEQPDINRFFREIQGDVRDLKARQIVGSDAVRTFRLETEDDWDIVDTSTGTPWQETITLRFSPESTLSETYAAGFRIGVYYELSPQYPYQTIQHNIRRKKITNPLHQDWEISLSTNDWDGSTTKRVKFFVFATGKGIVTLV